MSSGQSDQKQKYEFDLWVLNLPPINLWNVHLVYNYAAIDEEQTTQLVELYETF